MKIISKLYTALFLISALTFSACEEVIESNPATEDDIIYAEWLIPVSEVSDGGPGYDGIPSIDNPRFADPNSQAYLNDDDLIIGIKIGDEIRGYPHPILDWHEIVNDGINSSYFSITYCPLTGSGIAWDRRVDGNITTFGVSGLLYNSNLIPYDRSTKSNYSQMLLSGVNGQRMREKIITYHTIETSFKTWKDLFPDAKILSSNTGYDRRYGVYPYDNYKTTEGLIFPVNRYDDRLHRKARVLGILMGNKAAAFEISSFSSGDDMKMLKTIVKRNSLVLIGNSLKNILTAFYPILDNDKNVELNLTGKGSNFNITDQYGNSYDIFGTINHGPDKGRKLKAPVQFAAYWFAWSAFYPKTSLH
jgi:hypothetical protein